MTENPKIGIKIKIRGNQGRDTEFKRKEKSMEKMTKDNNKNERKEGFQEERKRETRNQKKGVK